MIEDYRGKTKSDIWIDYCIYVGNITSKIAKALTEKVYNVDIVELEEKVVTGIKIKTTNQEGKYAKYIIMGDVQNSVGQAWQEIWNMDIKRKYTCDLEEYQNNLSDMQKQEIHIYIALDD